MSFDNCAEAYAAGYANIPNGSPLYRPKLDRDQDGMACDHPPAGFHPHPAASATASVGARPAASDRLPTTGPTEVTGLGVLALAVGAAGVVLARHRRVRFRA